MAAIVTTAGTLAAGCSGEPGCDPPCQPAYACYWGVCLPAWTDAAVDARDDGRLDDGPRDEAPPDDTPDVEAAPGDLDRDGIPDEVDNCPTEPNPDQAICPWDAADALGDACDEDDDGDGIPDAVDLCNCTEPPTGDDEDDDGIPDPCDNCPEVPGASQADADGDGVGDLCEHPLGQDRVSERVAFYTFVDTPRWTAAEGSWRREGGVLYQDLPLGPAAAYSQEWTFGDDVMVRATLLWGVGAAPASQLAGVIMRVGIDSEPADWYFCCADRVEQTVQIWSRDGSGVDLLADEPLPFPIDGGVPYTIVGSALGPDLICAVETPGGPAGLTSAAASLPLSGGVGVRTSGTAASFTTVTVYR
jgi:hypothetical protein